MTGVSCCALNATLSTVSTSVTGTCVLNGGAVVNFTTPDAIDYINTVCTTAQV